MDHIAAATSPLLTATRKSAASGSATIQQRADTVTWNASIVVVIVFISMVSVNLYLITRVGLSSSPVELSIIFLQQFFSTRKKQRNDRGIERSKSCTIKSGIAACAARKPRCRLHLLGKRAKNSRAWCYRRTRCELDGISLLGSKRRPNSDRELGEV